MKFKLSTSGYKYTKNQVEGLEGLGFELKERSTKRGRYWYITNEPIDIEISCLEDLISFSVDWGELIIDHLGNLEIYNYYRE